jgi:RNA polymerase sigma-70 factor (ECF subfamily)
MDAASFAGIAEAMKARLYRMAFIYLASEQDATDAVSEAVYQGLKSLRSLRQPEFCETWLTRILINVCKQELRKRKRRGEVPLDERLEAAGGGGELDALPLKEAIRRLPNDLRDIVALRYLTGLTQAETADALGIPQGTVATRGRRALALLRLELEEESS